MGYRDVLREKRYVAHVREFQRRWWRAINARPGKSITEVAKEAAFEAGKAMQPSIMAVDVGLEWMASVSIEPAERVAELRKWFDDLGLVPDGVVVVGDFLAALNDLEAARASIAKGLAKDRQ